MNKIKDPIIEEIRKAREDYAEKFNYDVNAMCRDLMKRQAKHGDRVVTRKKILP